MQTKDTIKHISFGKKVIKAIPTAALLVGLAYVLSLVMSAPFSFTASFLNSTRPSDFDFADFYNIVAEGRPVRELDNKVIVVNLDRSDRAEIAATLDLLQEANPKAVGIDVLFQEPHDPGTDEWLISAIRSLDNVVITESLTPDESGNRFAVAEKSFFADTIGSNVTFGASNLPSRITAGTVREFPTEFPSAIDSNAAVPGFALAVAAKANPETLTEIRRRDNREEVINYPSREFRIFTPGELAESPEEANGKVVLLGAVSEFEDMHPTPIRDNMSGIMIHAYSVSTILNSNYIDRKSELTGWLVACLLCFIITLGFCVIPVKVKGLLLRLIQMLMLMAVIYTGYYLFVEKNIIVNFSSSLLMITFGLFACDLQLGLTTISVAAYNYLRKKVNAVKPNSQQTPAKQQTI